MIEIDLAKAARERFDLSAAEGRYSRALELLDTFDERRRMVALRDRGLGRIRTGRGHDALADLAEARRLAKKLGDAETELGLALGQAEAYRGALPRKPHPQPARVDPALTPLSCPRPSPLGCRGRGGRPRPA